jgi:signal transduction histidine kinase
LWGSTRNGLFSINLEHQKINNFDVGLGLERENFVMNSNFESQNGILFFGTNDGFISFKPEDISYNEVPPTIIFTEFTVFGEPMTFEKDLNFLDEIKLYDDQNYFSISFAALNYHQPDMNQYAFKMEGFDPDWRILKDGNSVSYSNLSEGSYTFRVRASNNNQVWNTEGAALKLVIIPPFWKMRWFRIVLFCLVGLLGVLFYRNRVKWVEKRRKILEKVVKERTQEIQVQKVQIEELNKELQKRNENLEIIVSERTKDLREANEELRRSNNELEHFAYAASHDMKEPIRMVSNFVQLLDKHYGEQLGENGKRYVKFAVDGVSRMSGLIQNLLEYATLGKAEMKFEKANLNEVVKDKLQDLQHFIKDRNGQMIIESVPEEIICEPEQVGMLFYNLIGNGFKFNKSDQPVVKVGLSEENEEVYQFFIEDNGIGIREEDTDKIFAIFKRLNHRTEFDGTGIGLAICKRIVQKHEGTISLTSEVGKGTTFYFTISKNLETKYSK